MSVPDIASKATDTDVSKAEANVIESVDAHTPDTPKHEPGSLPDPTDGHEGREDLTDTIGTLAARVETLENSLREVAAKAIPDEAPNKKRPWTMAGSKRK